MPTELPGSTGQHKYNNVGVIILYYKIKQRDNCYHKHSIGPPNRQKQVVVPTMNKKQRNINPVTNIYYISVAAVLCRYLMLQFSTYSLFIIINISSVLSPLLLNIFFFAAATEVVLVRFSEEDKILKDLVYLEEEAGVGAGTPLERARRAVWGMLYADDAGVVSRSQEGLTRMMTTIIVEVFGEFGLTVSEKKTETLLTRAPEKQPKKGGPPPPLPVIEAAGQKYAQTAQFRYLGGLVNEDGELTQEIDHRTEQSSVGMHQEVLPGALRPAESTVET